MTKDAVTIAKDASLTLFTTAALILTIVFGLIAQSLPASILLKIFVTLCGILLGISMITGMYGLARLFDFAKNNQGGKEAQAQTAASSVTDKISLASKYQFLFFGLGTACLFGAVIVVVFN